MKLLTTVEAAARKGVTQRRIQQLIKAELLPAEKFGRDYLIKERDLEKLVIQGNDGKVGRPRRAA